MEPKYEWDEDKRRANLEKHGIDFSAVYDFDWATATFLPDDRSGEYRTKAYGLIEERLHLLVYTYWCILFAETGRESSVYAKPIRGR